jgi:hypothetical protein
LDDRLAAEHDVLGADERGLARYFVARVLRAPRFREWFKFDRGLRVWELTVSMYSPLGGRLDMVAAMCYLQARGSRSSTCRGHVALNYSQLLFNYPPNPNTW